ncbi:sugar ABC transporter permease [Vibrio sp. EA2]|uniref:carbohydrate ABC transporter permease n=1 Tax=Vibrio sp. EA2 TaxID=3079860 RepID=UPI002949099A|nr:sugar ABC transporter permease [Vibrio sp. EA2]MDV6250544.1 sugar ABC transporter permease [Vibrio sp. EA2]
MEAILTQRSRKSRASLLPYYFVALPMIYLAVFMYWPLIKEMYMSLTSAMLTNPSGGKFIGLGNYELLFQDPTFFKTVRVTIVYSLLSVVFSVALGVVAALAINRPFPGRAIVRAILLFGWAVPSVAAALIWLWMYNERSGVFNEIAQMLGFDAQSWLTNADMAMTSIVLVTVWQAVPFVMLVVLAALQSVPDEVREAARIDGADALNVYRNVTWPHIRPAVQLVALLITVWSIRRYDLIYLLTGGGPLDSTGTLVVQLKQIAFRDYDLGVASAYGVVGLVLAMLVAAFHQYVERRQARK